MDNGQQITALRLPKRLVAPLSAAITAAWPDGLLRCAASPVQGGWEWEMNGWPFVQHVESRRIVFSMLQVLYAAGWAVQCANNINKHHLAKGTIYLKPGEPCAKTFFGISFFKEDRIRLIDAPSADLRAHFVAICKVSVREGRADTRHGTRAFRRPRRSGPAACRSSSRARRSTPTTARSRT
jgi:hypothetical protein